MEDYSVINYNPYNMYQNYGYFPAYRGVKIPADVGYNNVSQQVSQPDTVLFSANNELQDEATKQKSSAVAKFTIRAGVVSALAIGADFLFCKGKHVKNLYEQLKGKCGKLIVNPKNTQKTEGAAEEVQQKIEQILQNFNEGPFKDQPKSVKKLLNGKTTITIGEGTNRAVYIYDKNANPERMIRFFDKGYTVNVPIENGAWEISKVKRPDTKTGDVIIEKYGKEQPKTETKKPIEMITISKEQNAGLSGFHKHKYIRKFEDSPCDEESVRIQTMKFGDDTVRHIIKSKLNPSESLEWQIDSYVVKNNKRIDKRLWEVLTEE